MGTNDEFAGLKANNFSGINRIIESKTSFILRTFYNVPCENIKV